MAKVTFLNTNTFSEHINKLNDLSLDIGDITLLQTSEDSDIVGAINSLITQVGAIDSSGSLSVFTDGVGGIGNLLFDSDANSLTYQGAILQPSTGLSYDSATNVLSGINATTSTKGVASFATANFSVSTGAVSIKDGGVDGGAEIASSTITYDRFNSVVSLSVYDSSGSAVKTVYSPGA